MPNRDASDRQTVHYGDECAERGYGGETHQVAGDGTARLTTQQSVVVDDDQNTLWAGQRGPACKFIGHNGAARPLFEASGLAPLIDDGFISLDDHSAAEFIGQCSQLRYWPRQQVGVLS